MATITVNEGGTYATLSAGLAVANSGDTISIEGTWTSADTTAATVADDNITITTDSNSRHPGYVQSSPTHYRLSVSDGSHCLTINNPGCTVDGVVINQAASSGGSEEGVRIAATSGTTTFTDCIIYASNSVDNQDGVYFANQSIDVVLENCIIYGFSRAGIHGQNYSGSAAFGIEVNSCIIWNCGHSGETDSRTAGGIAVRSTNGAKAVDVHNTAILDCSDKYTDYREYIDGGSVTWGISYSIDSDNSIATVDGGGTGNLASRTITDNTSPGTGDWVIVEDITSAPYDLRLVDNAENDAQDAHATATAEGLTIPGTDIVGTTRPVNTNYDIGPFEITGGGGGTSVPVFFHHYRTMKAT